MTAGTEQIKRCRCGCGNQLMDHCDSPKCDWYRCKRCGGYGDRSGKRWAHIKECKG